MLRPSTRHACVAEELHSALRASQVQRYIGASSTLDPLFKADKLMIRAQQLVPDEQSEAYTTAVDSYITKQQISSTMAYTSSWSGIENPNGSVDQIEDNLKEAKKEVVETRQVLAEVVQILNIPAAPPYVPPKTSS